MEIKTSEAIAYDDALCEITVTGRDIGHQRKMRVEIVIKGGGNATEKIEFDVAEPIITDLVRHLTIVQTSFAKG